MPKRFQFQITFFLLGLLLVLSACQRTAFPTLAKEFDKSNEILSNEQMFHIKQVIECYDEKNTPIPRYFEVFVAKDERVCHELDAIGNTIQIMMDSKDTFLSYNPDTMDAKKYEFSQILSLDPTKMVNMTDYKAITGEAYEYCGRTCRVYGITNGNDSDDLRLYLDEKTGTVLFCDAPLFCIKTFSFEILAYGADYFQIPDDLKYD